MAYLSCFAAPGNAEAASHHIDGIGERDASLSKRCSTSGG